MIYLFEDREDRKRQFLGEGFNHSMIQHKPFDCANKNEIVDYVKQNYQDASAVLLHKSYIFENKEYTIDNVISGFKLALNIPVVLFSGGSNSRLIKDGNIITAEINSGIMYKNLTDFLNHYQATNEVCVPILVYGKKYRLNQLLEMQSKIQFYVFDKTYSYVLSPEDNRKINRIILSVTDYTLSNDIKKLQSWLEEWTKVNKPITVSLLLTQIQNLVNKYQL